MVSKASDDLPEPLTPVITVRVPWGISTSISRRLCSRAPRTRIDPLFVVGLGGFTGLALSRQSVDDPVDAVKGADVLVIATEWPEFQSVDLRAVRDAMTEPRVIDARNMLDPEAVLRLGMEYEGIGR